MKNRPPGGSKGVPALRGSKGVFALDKAETALLPLPKAGTALLPLPKAGGRPCYPCPRPGRPCYYKTTFFKNKNFV